jgi:hypothetical protein
MSSRFSKALQVLERHACERVARYAVVWNVVSRSCSEWVRGRNGSYADGGGKGGLKDLLIAVQIREQ